MKTDRAVNRSQRILNMGELPVCASFEILPPSENLLSFSGKLRRSVLGHAREFFKSDTVNNISLLLLPLKLSTFLELLGLKVKTDSK